MQTQELIDVRPILASGGCPFDTVLAAAKNLKQGDGLTLIAPFNPVPIHQALGGIGIDFIEANQDENGNFTVKFLFTPLSDRQLEADLDLTMLEPPQPMMHITEKFASALPGKTLGFRTRFKPMHLIHSLDPETTITESVEQTDGTWYTRLLKREVVRCEH